MCRLQFKVVQGKFPVKCWSLSFDRLFLSHGLQSTRLLCPWNSSGNNTGVGCHFLLQGIFPTLGLNPGLLHCRQIPVPTGGINLHFCEYRSSKEGRPLLARVTRKGSPCRAVGVLGVHQLSLSGWNGNFIYELRPFKHIGNPDISVAGQVSTSSPFQDSEAPHFSIPVTPSAKTLLCGLLSSISQDAYTLKKLLYLLYVQTYFLLFLFSEMTFSLAYMFLHFSVSSLEKGELVIHLSAPDILINGNKNVL